MEEKRLAKIDSVKFGITGYQDAQLGISFGFKGERWGINDLKAFWDPNLVECDSFCKWTEKERDNALAQIMRYISDLLRDAKVSTVDQLKNIPVEIITENNTLKSWRILTEVL